MRLSDFHDLAAHGVVTFGDVEFRGACPAEDADQITFFNRLRREYPDTWGALALHPRNEGLRTGGHVGAVTKHKAEAMTTGAADIIIPARVAFVCEMKRRDYTKSQWQDGQRRYLKAAKAGGAFACVALGHEAAWEAFTVWLRLQADQ